MKNVVIRSCRKEDESGIVNVCYHSGYMGEDLENKNIFNDVKLFGYLFCVYYVRYQINDCFVAEDVQTKQVIGYLLGALDTKKQEKQFILKMSLRILVQFLSCTVWNYPETLKTILFFMIHKKPDHPQNLYFEYPAHLHINILPDYQRYGIGSKLITEFENHVRTSNGKGIHLQTTNENVKAVSFYNKIGYTLIQEEKRRLWRGADVCESLIFAKKLDNPKNMADRQFK